MDTNFIKVEYTDAKYIDYTGTSDEYYENNFTLNKYESFGILSIHKDYIVNYFNSKDKELGRGIIIPKSARIEIYNAKLFTVCNIKIRNLISELKSSYIKLKLSKMLNQKIEVEWKDIVYFEESKHVPTYESSTMLATGVLHKITNLFIVIKDAKNMRILPTSSNHPDYKVRFYLIPLDFIKNFKKIQSNTY